MKPDKKQINEQIEKLLKLKPRVPIRLTRFGDDNHMQIDAQVNVLRDDIRDADIEDLYGEDDGLRTAAFEARAWMDGEHSEPGDLCTEWEELAK